MFRSVSWLQYIETILILLFIYYPLVILLYFRKDVMKYFTQGFPFSKTINNKSEIPEQKMQPAVHELMADLNGVFKNAADKKMIKEELILAIHNKINYYPQLKKSVLQNEIINHIAFECSHQCNINLSEEELKMLWQ